jgi:hypothetical protein
MSPRGFIEVARPVHDEGTCWSGNPLDVRAAVVQLPDGRHVMACSADDGPS